MDINQYLDRIKIPQIEEPSYSYLAKLQDHHLLSVPFENLDVLQGEEIVLDESRLYNKIVVRRRGGFCYELNGLFSWLLRELGFTVSMVSGRVYDPTDNSFSPEFDHMVLLAHLDKTYVIDVGFGDSFRKPIVLPDGEIEDVSGRYRIHPSHPDQDGYLLQKQTEGEWRAEYSFTTYPRKFTDFAKRCVFNQTSPESHFTQETVCTIATENGRVSLSRSNLTITEEQRKRKQPVTSPEEYRRILFEYFGIELKNV
jgi:N-hydroxyarylamine O-acetyltransferase